MSNPDPGERPEPHLDHAPDPAPGGPADRVVEEEPAEPLTPDQPRSAQVKDDAVPDEIEEPEELDEEEKDVEPGDEPPSDLWPLTEGDVRRWHAAWCRSRGYTGVADDDGVLRVGIGTPGRGVERLVLGADEDPWRIDRAAQAALSERDPWVTVPTSDPGRTADRLAEHGLRTPAVPEWLMSLDLREQPSVPLPVGYDVRSREDDGTRWLEVVDPTGSTAASGQLAVVDGCAVPDRIETRRGHRRRGLGAAVMSLLVQGALDGGATRGLLMASTDGRRLYTRLGWTTHQPVVIGRLW